MDTTTRNLLLERDIRDPDAFHLYSRRPTTQGEAVAWHHCSLHVDSVAEMLGDDLYQQAIQLNYGASLGLLLAAEVQA